MIELTSWAAGSLAVLTIGAARELIRLLIFTWGLSIALRGTTESTRAPIIEAYGRSAQAASGRATRVR